MKSYKYLLFALVLFTISACQKNQRKPLETGKIYQLTESGTNSAFSYFNTTPESHDGTKILYVTYKDFHTKRGNDVAGEVWVCNSDLSKPIKILDLDSCNSHNGARIQWINDDFFGFMDGSKIYIASISKKEIIHGPYIGRIGHHAFGNNILMSVMKQPNEREKGIYEINAITGEVSLIALDTIFYSFEGEFDPSHSTDRSTWTNLHLQYSPDGQRICFRFDVGDGEKNNPLFIINRDGTNPIHFGPKPMHFAWYDNETIIGHDILVDDGQPNDKSLRRWDLERNYLETLAGPGNHQGSAPDRSHFASDSWYRSDTVYLSIFRKGETKPMATYDVSADASTIWNLGWHVNPSFSRDGKRVYFNRTVGKGRVVASVVKYRE